MIFMTLNSEKDKTVLTIDHRMIDNMQQFLFIDRYIFELLNKVKKFKLTYVFSSEIQVFDTCVIR